MFNVMHVHTLYYVSLVKITASAFIVGSCVSLCNTLIGFTKEDLFSSRNLDVMLEVLFLDSQMDQKRVAKRE